MKKSIFKVLKYFSFFDYPPTFEEIYTFLPEKTTKKELKKEIDGLIRTKIIKKLKLKIENSSRYTIGEYSKKLKIKNGKLKIIREKINNLTIKQFNNFSKRYFESKKKLENWRFRLYIKLLFLFPQIKLIGLSGSLAMMNAGEYDDVDLFIITGENRLFTGRFIAIVLAWILGIKRTRDSTPPIFITQESCQVRLGSIESEKIVRDSFLKHRDKICLNLFFDESNLEVPDFKKNEYVAHEILQMKPIIDKDKTYEKFLLANRWVLKLFPNAPKIYNFKFIIYNQFRSLKIINYKLNKNLKLKINNLGDWIEDELKKFQLSLINKHKTSEIITDTQLWFHPQDFQRKIKK